MRFFYILLLSYFMMSSMYAKSDKEYSLKNHAGKVCLSLLATVYKHPFMTAWSVYASLPIYHADVQFLSQEKKLGDFTFRIHGRRSFITWFIDALLIGDFAHNMLHAYGVKHTPCFKEFCISCCDQQSIEAYEIESLEG